MSITHDTTSSVPQMKLATPTLPPTPSVLQNPAVARFSLSGKAAIVTGGAGGLGFEAARALLEHGVLKIALFDINTPVGVESVSRLKAGFPNANIVFKLVNVIDADIVNAAVDEVTEEFGHVDILLTFAGVVKCEHAIEMDEKSWSRVLDVNLTGSFLCSQAVARKMISQDTGGSIVLIASISGHGVNFPQPQVNYNISKAGVLMMCKSLATEWGRYGIRVNSISPGYMDTVLNESNGLEEHKKIWLARTPLGRMGGRDELNGAVVLLCSDAARFITGTDIKIDGGISALV